MVGKKFKEKTGKDLKDFDYNENDAENDKKSLSKRDKIKVAIGKTNIEITRAEFEESISSLLAQTEMLSETVIDSAKIKVQDIKEVFLQEGVQGFQPLLVLLKKYLKKNLLLLLM